MKTDVINGYEWLIFEESEIEQACTKVAEEHPLVRVATTCDDCGGYIEANIEHIEARNADPVENPIRHGPDACQE